MCPLKGMSEEEIIEKLKYTRDETLRRCQAAGVTPEDYRHLQLLYSLNHKE